MFTVTNTHFNFLPPVPKDHRWSEENFRRYENVIAEYMETYPAPLFFNPSPYALETGKCRLADAIRAYCHFRWTSPIDADTLAYRWSMNHTTRAENGTCLILHPLRKPFPPNPLFTSKIVTLGTPTACASPDGVFPTAQTEPLVVSAPSLEVCRALCLLHDNAILPHQTKLTNLTTDAITYLTTQSEFSTLGHMVVDHETVILI